MKRGRILFTLVLAVMIGICSSAFAFAAEDMTIGNVYINTHELKTGADKFFVDQNGEIQAPLRTLLSGLGYTTCRWNAEMKMATVPGGPEGDVRVQMKNQTIYYGGKTYWMNSEPVMKNGKMYVPLTGIAHALDFEVFKEKQDDGSYDLLLFNEHKPPIIVPDASEFNNILGEYTTWFKTSLKGRCENIRLATASLQAKIIMPGEEFSFNKTTGPTTASNGYKEATVIKDGKYTTGVGGGVCQVSTTLFNAALKSNMTITMRYPHSLKPAYVPLGMDASVSSGNGDFRFKNPYNEPVMIMTTYDGTKGYVAITIRAVDKTAPNTSVNVTKDGSTYTLKRSVDGVVNYTTTSKYND